MKLRTLNTAMCVFCEISATYDELPVCRNCILTLQQILDQKCKNCGNTPNECICHSSKPFRFLFFFDNMPSRTLIYWLKTNFSKRNMDFFVELMIKNSGINPSEFDGVTFVPRLKRNLKKYGYDQAEQMAKSVSEIFGIPFMRALKRVGKDEQKLLSYSQRKLKAKDKFALSYIPEEKFRKILIVDDIITTGATIDACAEKLRKGFAKEVVTLVMATTNYQKN